MLKMKSEGELMAAVVSVIQKTRTRAFDEVYQFAPLVMASLRRIHAIATG
jgi:hypothetical protein